MDIATLVGIVTAFSLVITAITLGGSITLFINVPAMMIVIGGTLGSTMINYPLPDILKVFRVVRNAFFHEKKTSEGIIEGVIAFEPQGEHGFGYDPIFFIPEFECTMAQLPPETKNRISHRARAAQAALPIIWRLVERET